MLHGIKFEICTGSLEDMRIASQYEEVDRLECNSHLEEDGLSMDHDEFLVGRKESNKELICMVRPRGGNFIYTDKEKEEMLKEAEFFLQNGADGIVFGAITEEEIIDVPFSKKIIDLIHQYHKIAVFHKAFDCTKDLSQASQTLIDLHCDRILTSGAEPNCELGLANLILLNEQFSSRIQILPGGGVTSNNVTNILEATKCTTFHMSLRSNTQTPNEKVEQTIAHLKKFYLHSSSQRSLTGEDIAMFENDTYEQSLDDIEDDHNRQ